MRPYHWIVTALATGTLATSLQAMDLEELDRLQERRRRLESEEQQINRSLQNANTLSQRLGIIRHIQDKLFTSQDGALVRANVWFGQANSWLNQWENLLKTTDSFTSANASQIEASLDQSFKSLAESYDALTTDGEKVRALFRETRQELLALDPLPTALTPSQENQFYIQSLNSQHKRIIDFTSTMELKFEASYSMTLKEQMEKSRKLLEKQLVTLQLRFPALRQTLENARKKLAFVASFESFFTGYRRKCLEAEDMFGEFRIFEGERTLKALQAEKIRIFTELDGLGVEGPLLEGSKRQIQRLLDRAQLASQESTSAYTKLEAFALFVDNQRRNLSNDCRDEKLRNFRDCELLSVLNRVKVDEESLANWKPADMAYFEQQLIKVRKSTSFGLGGQ